MALLKFWRDVNPETGHLKRSFETNRGNTRFLGDLYQELSDRAKKKYALLQTPVFVEEFILDRTLTPALAEFGLEKVRMIDPTCGSGPFCSVGSPGFSTCGSRERVTKSRPPKTPWMASGAWTSTRSLWLLRGSG
jgi:hypothetical protein